VRLAERVAPGSVRDAVFEVRARGGRRLFRDAYLFRPPGTHKTAVSRNGTTTFDRDMCASGAATA
jgi:hypothetical protein